MAKHALPLPEVMELYSDSHKVAAAILNNSPDVVKKNDSHSKQQEKPRKKLKKEAGDA